MITCQSELWAEEPPKARNQDDLKELVRGNNEFAFDLYRQLSKKEGNLIFSPYSISTALAMTYAGARGETAEQMAKTLRFTLGQERLHPAFAANQRQLLEGGKPRPYQLFVANALWGQQGFLFVPDFLRLTKKHYGGGLREVDFSGKPKAARLTINRWVADQTKDKIKELLKPEDVNSVTRLILTNAIYLKAGWAVPFPEDQTKEALFEVTATKKMPVPMMHIPRYVFNNFSGKDFKLLELAYKGDRLSMVVLLPTRKGQLAEVEKSLTLSGIQEGLAKLKEHLGDVTLPRFKVREKFRLKEELKAMGMPIAFTPEADFSGITSRRSLWIDEVIHQAFIHVDEQGTEAAAGTAVKFVNCVPPPFSFRADHPFLFMIRDKASGSILFLGRVEEPFFGPSL